MKNGMFTALRFGIFTLSGIFFIPFLLRQYGSGSYGLIALAGFLTQYVGSLTGCIGGSIARFLNIALNKQDLEEAGQIFSTAFVCNALIVLLQIPLFALGFWKLESIIDFPPELAWDFKILVGCNVLVYIISVLTSALGMPIQASNRLDIGLKLEVLFQIIRLTLQITLILNLGPKLWILGVVDLGLSLIGVAVIYKLYKYLARDLVFRWDLVSLRWMRPVFYMAGWTLVAEVGQVLFQKTDVWIVNRFVDMQLAGVCAALLIWPNFTQQIAKHISSLLMPVVMIDYAHGRFARIRDTVLLMVDVFCLMSLFICALAMLFGGWGLEMWMGQEYRKYQLYLILMLLHFPLTLAREAIWPLFPAFNEMKWLGISNIVSGILNICLSLLAVYWGYGLSGVIIASGISLVLQRTLLLSYFAAKLLDIRLGVFFRRYIPGVIIVVLFMLQITLYPKAGYLFIGMFAMTLAVLGSGIFLITNKVYRRVISSIFRKEK